LVSSVFGARLRLSGLPSNTTTSGAALLPARAPTARPTCAEPEDGDQFAGKVVMGIKIISTQLARPASASTRNDDPEADDDLRLGQPICS
jgi:hypothetical protein